ncbi:DUF3256 family protein [Dysgonomonas sp. Marseille-P4361]|uniref:DUF3256 family protein n=1 Tax=Dysgonomonas sp. Marseille-P4361 TaxID=2161820 RepID=UPI000D556267|nr:DUF3256 family protein [Dysgonomonas sp. Marseille-P4361]
MKKIVLIIALISTSLYISAQELQSIFLSMPENLILGLEATERDKLTANTSDTTQISVIRSKGSNIKRLAISPDYISLQTSEAGTIQIKLLPLINESKIICVVRTVCGKICDSQLQFYTTKWIPIEQNLFPRINKDWFIKADADRDGQDFKNAYAALDMTPTKIELSPSSTEAKVFYDIKSYLSEDDYKKIQPFLTEEPKILEWDKVSFKE